MDKEILKELRDIKSELAEIKESCKRMDSHIGFVDRTYATLRTPLDWISKKFSARELPAAKFEMIEAKKNK